jgi:hypothetical protein
MFVIITKQNEIKKSQQDSIMNALIKTHDFSKDNLSFLDTKPNTLISGLFTKINYSDAYLTMYGLYVNIPFETNAHKNKLNTGIFRLLCDIEINILADYIKFRKLDPDKVNVAIKFGEYLQNRFEIVNTAVVSTSACAYIKVSGVWENTMGNIGLSFRIVQGECLQTR